MSGKENIINKILADADNKCAEILSTAESQAQEIADGAREYAENEQANVNRRLEVLREERQRNSLATAQLEARKYKLLQKQKLISACYEKALTELANLDKKQKIAFLTKLIKTYAERGETVFISSADKDVVTQKFLDGFGLDLTLGKTYIESSGGLVLSGENYDKDLSLEKIVAFAREQTEAKVASALFGDKNE